MKSGQDKSAGEDQSCCQIPSELSEPFRSFQLRTRTICQILSDFEGMQKSRRHDETTQSPDTGARQAIPLVLTKNANTCKMCKQLHGSKWLDHNGLLFSRMLSVSKHHRGSNFRKQHEENMKKTCWISAIPRLSQQYAQASQDIASSFAWQIAPVPPDDSKLEHCQVSWSHGSH